MQSPLNVPLGKGWHNTGTTVASGNYLASIEGTKRAFADYRASVASLPRRRLSAGDAEAILVRNVSTISLVPKKLVTWQTGYVGKRVDGYARLSPIHAQYGVDAGEVAGVVDPNWPSSGVPVGECFWLFVRGQCLCKSSITPSATLTVWVEGEPLVAMTAANSTMTTDAGHVCPIDMNTATEALGNNLLYHIGKAVSACATSGVTNTDRLVNLQLPW